MVCGIFWQLQFCPGQLAYYTQRVKVQTSWGCQGSGPVYVVEGGPIPQGLALIPPVEGGVPLSLSLLDFTVERITFSDFKITFFPFYILPSSLSLLISYWKLSLTFPAVLKNIPNFVYILVNSAYLLHAVFISRRLGIIHIIPKNPTAIMVVRNQILILVAMSHTSFTLSYN